MGQALMDHDFSKLGEINPDLAAQCREAWQEGKPLRRVTLPRIPRDDERADEIRDDEEQKAQWTYQRQHHGSTEDP